MLQLRHFDGIFVALFKLNVLRLILYDCPIVCIAHCLELLSIAPPRFDRLLYFTLPPPFLVFLDSVFNFILQSQILGVLIEFLLLFGLALLLKHLPIKLLVLHPPYEQSRVTLLFRLVLLLDAFER